MSPSHFSPQPALSEMRPLRRGYAHRDCEFSPPLWYSLQHGFRYLEADVYCLGGRMLVAHDPWNLRPWRTLETLYLAPLRRYLRANGNELFLGGEGLWLFIDIKTRAQPSYRRLDTLLSRYDDVVSTFTPGTLKVKPVTVVISGNRPSAETLRGAPWRYAALDGRLADLGVHTDPQLTPVISDNWGKTFSWRGRGAMPAHERQRLSEMVRVAHRHGQKLRFWGTPDAPSAERTRLWETLVAADIDLINTDDLAGLRGFLLER